MADRVAPHLSICIPSYNRAAFLPVLLESIERELSALPPEWDRDCVEVVLCDNASQDETPAIVAAFAERMRLVYRRHSENIGADRNYLAIVENATGTFCWLMGSDDAIAEGGLLRVLEASREWHGAAGFSVNFATYDSDLKEPVESREPVALNIDTLVQGSDVIFTTFVGYWGYLAAHVVRRDLWERICATGDHLGFLNAYVHVYIMGRMAQEQPSWGYVTQRCVMWRSGNDSFLAGSTWLRRMKLDVVGYHQITDALFGESSPAGRRARDAIADRHILAQYRSAKARGRPALGQGAALIARYYWKSSVFWTRLLPWIIVPSLIVRPLFGLYLDRRAKRLKADTRR